MSTVVLLAGVGVLSHLLLFIRIEPLIHGPILVLAFLTAPAIVFGSLCGLTSTTCYRATITTTLWYIAYSFGVILSISMYRLFFHRLRKFPGPLPARLTQLYHVSNVAPKVDHARKLMDLHQKYGDFVRVGPNMLSVADPSIVNIAHGPQSKFEKSDWYEVAKPLTSLQQMTDHTLHDRRRRHGWDKAFTGSALRSYDSRIEKYTNQLIAQLHRRAGQKINAQEWVGHFAFDVMGDLAFGQSFEALEKGESHWFIDAIRQNGVPIGVLSTTPWILQTMFTFIPTNLTPSGRLLDHSAELMEQRKNNQPKEPDIASHILDAGPFFTDPHVENLLLTGDTRLLVIAGSDTTTATLSHVLYYLASDPEIADNLREELEDHNLYKNGLTIPTMSQLSYLNAVINETMRLHPPVPGGVYRKSPQGGVTVGEYFIPEGCIVLSPHYVIQRSPKAFQNPNEFIPERWTTKSYLIIDKSAFFPFLTGRYGCIGKQLAYNEIRNVILKLILEFDIAFAEGEDGSRLLHDTQDHFTLGLAPLDLIFTSRN